MYSNHEHCKYLANWAYENFFAFWLILNNFLFKWLEFIGKEYY